MQSPIEASSVQTDTLPWRLYFCFKSLNPFKTIPYPYLIKFLNYVQEPNASPIPIPRTAPIPLDYLILNFKI